MKRDTAHLKALSGLRWRSLLRFWELAGLCGPRYITNDREASVRYFIERTDSQKAVVCTLIARDFDKNIVGQIDQEIGAGKAKVELVTAVPTRSEAVNADVSSCRAA